MRALKTTAAVSTKALLRSTIPARANERLAFVQQMQYVTVSGAMYPYTVPLMDAGTQASADVSFFFFY